MIPTRRSVLTAALGAASATAATASALAGPRKSNQTTALADRHALLPDDSPDHTGALQSEIDAAAAAGRPVQLAPGSYRIGTLVLRPGTVILGTAGLTTLSFIGGARAFLTAEDAPRLRLSGLVIDGGNRALLTDDENAALLALSGCPDLDLHDVVLRNSLANGLSLTRCSGRVRDCTISHALLAGLRSIDAGGLAIQHNAITDCGNAGIQIWRTSPGDDGTQVSGNRIQGIAAKGGGTGENGNGVNVFRAGGVAVSNNRISDCAFSAVRGNAASNFQILANSCARLGEVAIYAEFGFEGAVIANNIVDGAGTGISVTNFNEGGRLAVIEGNLIRNLFRRENDPNDKRGEGITAEADSIVSGNVIEGAPTCGILVGWGPYMRNCMVTNNLVRDAKAGILITSDPAGGACLVSGNMISGTETGAIRAMDHGRPHGPDLALAPVANARITINGNMVS